MKTFYNLLSFVVLFSAFGFSQSEDSFAQDIHPLQLELENWDPIRGPWLSSSLMALSNNEPIPDRTFPEDVTPSEMISNLPEKTRAGMEQVILRHKDSQNESWNVYRNMILRPNAGCQTYSSRSYGDPHLETFDGARYSFQTVGEFVLTKSSNGMEVQARQGAQGDDFSVNTAVAMNVGGDRVALYMRTTPDGITSTPLRINSQPIVANGSKAIFLPSGGTVRKTGKVYLITWPTGEKVQAKTSGYVGRGFINVSVVINECNKGYVTGLLGNANGDRRDDFDREMDFSSTNSMNDPFDLFDTRITPTIQRRNLAYIANIIGDRFRVTPATSLFDYPFGRSTHDFTDRSFPRFHRTIHDLSRTRFNNARNNCIRAGISQAEMNGCIYDNAYMNFDPEPRTPVQGAREVNWEPISNPRPNVNDEGIVLQRKIEKKVVKNSGNPPPPPRPPLTPRPYKPTKEVTNSGNTGGGSGTGSETARPYKTPSTKGGNSGGGEGRKPVERNTRTRVYTPRPKPTPAPRPPAPRPTRTTRSTRTYNPPPPSPRPSRSASPRPSTPSRSTSPGRSTAPSKPSAPSKSSVPSRSRGGR